ncbi:hypothetical protein [Lacticaseibacillus paracasei]
MIAFSLLVATILNGNKK